MEHWWLSFIDIGHSVKNQLAFSINLFFVEVENKSSTLNSSGAHEFIPAFSGVPVAQTFVFCVVFYKSLFVLSSCSCWPLHWLSFLDLRLLMTLLVFSNFSFSHDNIYRSKIYDCCCFQKQFEGTKWVIINRKLKDRQYNT